MFEFANDSPATYNGSYGMNNWSYVAPYVDMIGTGYTQAQAANVPLIQYTDPNLCSGSYSSGANPYPAPDCARLSSDAAYTESGYASRPLATSYNGQILQVLGNPNSSSMLSAMASLTHNRAASMRTDAVFIDDAQTPDEYHTESSHPVCWGAGSFSSSGYSCSGASGGSASAPWSASYSVASWQQGEATLAGTVSAPAIFNDLGVWTGNESNSAIASVAASASHVWGAMCETCFYGHGSGQAGSYVYTGAALTHQLSDVMMVIGAGRHVIVQDDDVTDPGQRARALADMMLAYDENLMYEAGPCGNRSHISACIEAALVFENPVGPYPSSPAAVQSATGAYERKFGACFNGGHAVGPCAAVVNPNHGSSVGLPGDLAGYHHTLVITGDALCQCFGDSGSLSVGGPAAPSTLAPATAYVLFM